VSANPNRESWGPEESPSRLGPLLFLALALALLGAEIFLIVRALIG
jgi:hypothetical protein